MTREQRVYLIAGLSGADPRTVRRYLEGAEIRGTHLKERLDQAVKAADKLDGERAGETEVEHGGD